MYVDLVLLRQVFYHGNSKVFHNYKLQFVSRFLYSANMRFLDDSSQKQLTFQWCCPLHSLEGLNLCAVFEANFLKNIDVKIRIQIVVRYKQLFV